MIVTALALFRSYQHSLAFRHLLPPKGIQTRRITSKMSQQTMTVTFLGTSSGGGPSESRNCSSLVYDPFGNGTLWMVDCAEGTYRQFSLQPRQPHSNPGDSFPNVRANRVSKIFITHMHADHVMGIVPFLRGILNAPPAIPTNNGAVDTVKPPSIEIYGPAGIRTFVRQILKMTLTKTADNYTVHELLSADDPVTPCLPSTGTTQDKLDAEVLHVNEIAGEDFECDESGLWRTIASQNGPFGEVIVDAGPIAHRDPAIGFVFRETQGPQRKLVILGDTYDPSAITPLCLSPSPTLLIHEATDCCIPNNVDYNHKRTPEQVLERTLARGHSLPTMAGTFAKTIGAKQLVLNHIGSRFPAPRHPRDHRSAVMREIERQATQAWGSGRSATAAYDFLRIEIPPIYPGDQQPRTQQPRHRHDGSHPHAARRNRNPYQAPRERQQVQRNAQKQPEIATPSSDDDDPRASTPNPYADPNEGLINDTTQPNNKRRKNRH